MKPIRSLLSLALSACLATTVHAAGPPPTAISPGVRPCEAGEACAPADAEVAAAADLLVDRAGAHRLLLIGETHGTRECPALVARMAERYAQQGPVFVALELSSSIDGDVQRFLSSDGSPQARAALLQPAYWHMPKERSDGRRNFEVIELLERLRALRAQGKAVSVRAIDVPIDQPLDSERRDQAMAGKIREAFLALPAQARLLALTGNVHAMRAKPLFAPPEMQTPMGSRLLDLDPYSVRIVAGGGQSWACMAAACGPQVQPERPAASVESSDPSYDFLLAVPRFTLARLIPE
jgi:erythromycin esterase-like protein